MSKKLFICAVCNAEECARIVENVGGNFHSIICDKPCVNFSLHKGVYMVSGLCVVCGVGGVAVSFRTANIENDDLRSFGVCADHKEFAAGLIADIKEQSAKKRG